MSVNKIIRTPFFKFLGYKFIPTRTKGDIQAIRVRYPNGVIATYKLDSLAWNVLNRKFSLWDEQGEFLNKPLIMGRWYRAAIHSQSKRVIALQRNNTLTGK